MAAQRKPGPPSMPFSHGIAWLVQSASLMRRQTGRLLLIALLMQVILGLTQVPLLGLLVILAVPSLSAGILEAFDVTRRGGRPGPNLLFRPLFTSSHAGRLFLMGALIFAVGVVSVSLILSGSEELMDTELMSRIERGDVEAILKLNQESLGRILLAFLIGLSVSGTLSFFSIPLIWFRNRPIGAALAEGIRALVVNWKALTMLALGVAVIAVPLALLCGFLLGLAGTGGLMSLLTLVAVMILLLGFQMLLFGTQYCAFLDIFGLEEKEGQEPPEDDSQLLA